MKRGLTKQYNSEIDKAILAQRKLNKIVSYKMKTDEALIRISRKIDDLKKTIAARSDTRIWAAWVIRAWKDELEFYEHIKSVIEGKENK